MSGATKRRKRASIESGTLSPNPWDLTPLGRNVWCTVEGTRTEDRAPQGCDPSAGSSAGMARGGFDAEAAPKIQTRHRRILACCGRKMVLTMGSTLGGIAAWKATLRWNRRGARINELLVVQIKPTCLSVFICVDLWLNLLLPARTYSTRTDCRLRGDTALPAPSRRSPATAGSGRPTPASNPHSAPSRLRPTASWSTGRP